MSTDDPRSLIHPVASGSNGSGARTYRDQIVESLAERLDRERFTTTIQALPDGGTLIIVTRKATTWLPECNVLLVGFGPDGHLRQLDVYNRDSVHGPGCYRFIGDQKSELEKHLRRFEVPWKPGPRLYLASRRTRHMGQDGRAVLSFTVYVWTTGYNGEHRWLRIEGSTSKDSWSEEAIVEALASAGWELVEPIEPDRVMVIKPTENIPRSVRAKIEAMHADAMGLL